MRMRWVMHVARIGNMGNAYNLLVGKPEGKRPLGRPKSMLDDNIKSDLRETGWEGVDSMRLVQDRDECQHSNEPSGAIKGGELLE
jgi:hypothetical protein